MRKARHRTHAVRARAADRPPVLLAVLLAGLVGLSGCGQTVEHGREEVHPQVETTYEQAIRSSLAEVPTGRLLGLELRTGEEGRDGRPVWHSEVVGADGTLHTATLGATGAEVPTEHPVPGPERPAGEHVTALLDSVVVLPEDAVRKVVEPDFGKVESLELSERAEAPVWTIDVATVEEHNVHRYEVDALTGDVLDRSEVGS